MTKIFINKSKLNGNGIFSIRDIKKGEKLFRFSNNLITIKHKIGCNCKVCRMCINIKKDKWLYPKDSVGGWNLNHSCNPNAYIKGRDIFAFRNIKSNKEITIDYSTTNIDKLWKMKCNCKNKTCRKIISGVLSLPKHIFNKYKGFMPKYVEENYKKHGESKKY